jgi:hypothetical protein
MPLVHRLSGTGFASDDEKTSKLKERPPTYPGQMRPTPQPLEEAVGSGALCILCATHASTFDLSMRCCLDRYEALFGSVNEHRSMFAHARMSALEGDFMPAHRLVESYRRVFGPMAAVELKRTLWQSIADGRPASRAPEPGHSQTAL